MTKANASPQTGDKVLTHKQAKAIIALLVEPALQDAADSAGVNAATLWRWQKQPQFAEAYKAARRDAVMRSVARLQQATGEAVNALRDVMRETGPGTSAPRVSAARAVLEFAIKGTEIEDLAERVAELERVEAQRQRDSKE